MSDKNAQNEKPAEQAAASTGKKSGLIMYLVYGVICLGLVAGAAFGTLFYLQKTQPAPVASTEADSTSTKTPTDAHAKKDAAADDHTLAETNVSDSLLTNDSDGFTDELHSNMEALGEQLNAEAKQAELSQDPISPEDSIAAAAWITKEEARLTAKDKELTARAATLDKQERSIAQKLSRLEQAESARISNLAKVYDGMETAAVARLMSNLDDETVVAVLPRMKQKNASSVLSLLPPQRAASLSKQMVTIAETE